MNLESFQVDEYKKLLEGQGNSTPCPVHLSSTCLLLSPVLFNLVSKLSS